MNQHALIIALSATIVELNTQVVGLQESLDEQATIIDNGFIRFSDQEELISSLRHNLSSANSETDRTWADLDRTRAQVVELENQLRAFRTQDPAIRQKAADYMATTGHTLRSTYPGCEHQFDKIGCIKVVREITGFGLKDAKDFVENWATNNPGKCQDDKPASNCG